MTNQMKMIESLHAYSSSIGPSIASQMQNKSVFRYFFCNASYTPAKIAYINNPITHTHTLIYMQILFQIKRISVDVPFSIQSMSLRDSASIGMSFLIFISENEIIIPKKIINRYLNFRERERERERERIKLR